MVHDLTNSELDLVVGGQGKETVAGLKFQLLVKDVEIMVLEAVVAVRQVVHTVTGL